MAFTHAHAVRSSYGRGTLPKTDRNNRKRLIIDFNKEILTPINGNDGKLGRHLKKIDFDAIERMKAEGMTNTQIYKRLGIAKSTYYLKLREYNQNL